MATQRRLSKKKWLDGNVHMAVEYRTQSSPVSMHLHEFYELEIIMDGLGEQNLNGSLYPLSPGTVYLITPIDFHSIRPHSHLQICNIKFDETMITPALQMNFMNRRHNLIFSSGKDTGSMLTLAQRLHDECHESDAFSEQARKNILELLLFSIARSAQQQSSDIAMLFSHAVQDSMQYLFQHFREEITLQEVANKSGYTANYFSHLFHETCGQRYVDFLNRLRLNYAKMLLLSTDHSINHIAQTSGFSSQSNFFRVFRAETGISPLEFRKQHNRLI